MKSLQFMVNPSFEQQVYLCLQRLKRKDGKILPVTTFSPVKPKRRWCN